MSSVELSCKEFDAEHLVTPEKFKNTVIWCINRSSCIPETVEHWEKEMRWGRSIGHLILKRKRRRCSLSLQGGRIQWKRK